MTKVADAADSIYDVTFTRHHGHLPLMDVRAACSPAACAKRVARLQMGVTEIQTVTTSCDREFVAEEQTLTVPEYDFNFTLYLDDADDKTVTLSHLTTAEKLEEALEATAGIYDVTVTKDSSAYTELGRGRYSLFRVTFLDPVGDLPDLIANTTSLSAPGANNYGPDYPNNASVSVVEVVKGYSGLAGTFSLAFEGAYTADLAFDASAADVKAGLEALATVEEVAVAKESLGSGHRWTVTFTRDLGNLGLLAAMPYRFEEQTVYTTGGDPTPLGGAFAPVQRRVDGRAARRERRAAQGRARGAADARARRRRARRVRLRPARWLTPAPRSARCRCSSPTAPSHRLDAAASRPRQRRRREPHGREGGCADEKVAACRRTRP